MQEGFYSCSKHNRSVARSPRKERQHMAQQIQMPAMDLDSILESEMGTPEPAAQPNSEGPATGSEEPPAQQATGEGGEGVGVVTPEGKQDPEPETEPNKPQGGQRRPYSRLEKAEYSATKWKRKAKKLADERDALKAEFDRYKSLTPAAFRNPQERMQFEAWKASTAQRLSDMDEDLNRYAEDEAEDIYEGKIAQNYSTPESVDAFRKLDDHYGAAFEHMCRQVDPDGIIMDYLKDSPYEPAMRNVIFKNGDLQEELFRVYRNPAIGNARRQQILQRLEAQVEAYYNRQSNVKPVAQPAAKPQPVQQGTEPQPQQTAPAERKPRFQLPPRQKEGPATKPQVTGSLTRGDAGGSEPDTSAQADQMFTQLFGAGR